MYYFIISLVYGGFISCLLFFKIVDCIKLSTYGDILWLFFIPPVGLIAPIIAGYMWHVEEKDLDWLPEKTVVLYIGHILLAILCSYLYIYPAVFNSVKLNQDFPENVEVSRVCLLCPKTIAFSIESKQPRESIGGLAKLEDPEIELKMDDYSLKLVNTNIFDPQGRYLRGKKFTYSQVDIKAEIFLTPVADWQFVHGKLTLPKIKSNVIYPVMIGPLKYALKKTPYSFPIRELNLVGFDLKTPFQFVWWKILLSYMVLLTLPFSVISIYWLIRDNF